MAAFLLPSRPKPPTTTDAPPDRPPELDSPPVPITDAARTAAALVTVGTSVEHQRRHASNVSDETAGH
jgi:hypothetical protein